MSLFVRKTRAEWLELYQEAHPDVPRYLFGVKEAEKLVTREEFLYWLTGEVAKT